MKKVGKQMKKRKKALSFSAAVLLGATLTATSMSNIVFAENDTTADLTSEEKNTMIYKLLKLMERENTDLTVEFYIRYNKKNELEFTWKRIPMQVLQD